MKTFYQLSTLCLIVATPVFGQLTGTYDVAGGANDYATLSAAFGDVNTNGVSGVVTLRLMGNFTDPGTTSLTRTDLTSSNRLVIRPGASSVVVTMSSTLTIDGADYVTIDGSQTEGGTTRDLSFEISTGGSGTTVIQVQGLTNSDSIKNCDVGYSGSVPDHAILVSNASGKISTVLSNVRMGGIGNYSSDNAAGILGMNNAQGTTVIEKCIILGRGSGSTDAYGIYLGTTSGTVNISKNQMNTLLNGGSGELVGLKESFNSAANVNIFNNMFGGNFQASSTPSVYHIIELNGGGNFQVFHNTAVLNSISDVTNTGACVAILVSPGTVDMRNNILINGLNDAFAACIYLDTFFTSPADVTSDYNDLYITSGASANGKTGYDGLSDYQTLANWQGAFNPNFPDANSVAKVVTFSSTTNLHVTGSSNGDIDLLGTDAVNATVPTDIDDETRLTGTSGPYMGADEGSNALPVQVTSISAFASRLDAILRWSTANEVNNYGFEVERRSMPDGASWTKIGFVPGAGTTSGSHEYSFEDRNLVPGRYAYRIKQVDHDGTYEYYVASEVEVGRTEKILALESNFPNPFNPETQIAFSVPRNGNTVLKVFNLLGQEVAVLFEGFAEAGNLYQARFDASALPTGLYFSRLEFDGQTLMRKMLYVK